MGAVTQKPIYVKEHAILKAVQKMTNLERNGIKLTLTIKGMFYPDEKVILYGRLLIIFHKTAPEAAGGIFDVAKAMIHAYNYCVVYMFHIFPFLPSWAAEKACNFSQALSLCFLLSIKQHFLNDFFC